jgi:hypothetical protein
VLSGIDVDIAYCVRMATQTFNKAISAYPNPATTILNLDDAALNPVRIEVFDLIGHCMHDSPWRKTIDVASWPEGLYLLRITFPGGELQTLRVEVVR